MPKWVRRLLLAIPLIIIVAGLGAFVVWSRQPDRFPLRKVEIRSPLKHLQESEVQAAVAPLLTKGFFWVNVWSLQDSVKELPWVQSVIVKRVWPDCLQIVIQEKVPQARWGEKGVLSTDAVIFYPKGEFPNKLPFFAGPDERAKDVLKQYFTLLEILGPLGLTVQRLELSREGSWKMMLDNGLGIILGKAALEERMARFVLAYQARLQAESHRIDYIDLRYTNGFAIGWKADVNKKAEDIIHNAQKNR